MQDTSDVSRRLGELSARYCLSDEQFEQLARLLGRVAADEQTPTTVRDPRTAVDIHLADSLVALELDFLRGARRLVDIGAGAGFPGLPLAIALPKSDISLLESQSRKCSFLESVCAEVGIGNARVVCARVEEWADGIGIQDVALARAVAPAPVVLEYAAPLLRTGGRLVDWRGMRDPEEESQAEAAAEELGLERVEVRRVEPFEGVRDHHLHVYLKVRETPERFPRRVGTARKRPLGR